MVGRAGGVWIEFGRSRPAARQDQESDLSVPLSELVDQLMEMFLRGHKLMCVQVFVMIVLPMEKGFVCNHTVVGGLRTTASAMRLRATTVLQRHGCGVLRIAPERPKVVALKKTSTACPSQWEAPLKDGRTVTRGTGTAH